MELIKKHEFDEILKNKNVSINKDITYSLKSNESYYLYEIDNDIYIEGILSGAVFKVSPETVKKSIVEDTVETKIRKKSITQKTQKTPKITDEIKALILKYKSEGLTPSKIGRKLKIKTIDIRKVLEEG